MPRFSKKARAFAAAIGLDPDAIAKEIKLQTQTAINALVDILEIYIDDINRTSDSGALGGYRVISEKINPKNNIVLPRSGAVLDVSGFSYIVYVEAPSHHKEMDLNVFDLIDSGRKELPSRVVGRDSEGKAIIDGPPYILWGWERGKRSRVSVRSVGGGAFPKGAGKRASIARLVESSGAARSEPRFIGQRPAEGDRVAFSYGPIRKVGAQNLYEKAFIKAKRDLGRLISKELWDVIYVPNREKWTEEG